MIGFFLKKNFADGWDNFLMLLAYNVGLLLWGGAIGFCWFETSPIVEQYNSLLPWVTLMLGIGLFMIPVFAFGANAQKIADFNTPSVSLFFRSMKVIWPMALGFAALTTIVSFAAINAIPYYWTNKSLGIAGPIIAECIGLFLAVSVISMQYFIPLYFLQEQNGFKKSLIKSYIIFFDNPMFSIFLFLYNALLFGLSCVLLFIVPGFHGITISTMNATRLRLYKYDWLEANDGLNDVTKRSNIPWDELLAEDKESLGPLKFTSFLFPWK